MMDQADMIFAICCGFLPFFIRIRIYVHRIDRRVASILFFVFRLEDLFAKVCLTTAAVNRKTARRLLPAIGHYSEKEPSLRGLFFFIYFCISFIDVLKISDETFIKAFTLICDIPGIGSVAAP